MNKFRLLVDTNILFSGIIFSGPEAELLDLAREGKVDLLIPSHVIIEAQEVIARKMPHFDEVLKQFLSADYLIKLPPPPDILIQRARNIIEDPKDAPILASALDTHPDFVISGDKDFHTPQVQAVISVATSTEILKLLSDVNDANQ